MSQPPSPSLPGREVHLDNLRVYLTILVIFHHAAVTYGAPGGWYYSEPLTGGLVAGIVLTLFVSTNQSFFMGLFFFLSAYFVLPALVRKGPLKFLADRLKRLGIPLIVYITVLSPAIIMVAVFGEGFLHNMLGGSDYFGYKLGGGLGSWMGVGVLWFTAALLLFSLIYVALYRAGVLKPIILVLPEDKYVLLLGLTMGLVSFLIRVVFPIGETLPYVGFQPAHFTQYIVLFTLGFVAYRNDWIEAISYERGHKWLQISAALVFLGMPCLYALKFFTHVETDAFLGGLTIQSFANAIWEQVLGVSMIMALLGLGKVWWPKQGSLLKRMSRSAYAVYIIHPLMLVTTSIVLTLFTLSSLVKFIVAGSVATVVSFVVAAVLVRLPGVRNVI